MEIIIGSVRPEEDMDQNAYPGMLERHKKSAGGITEVPEMKVKQEKGKRQETSYDMISPYGDTLSISEEGRAVNMGKNDKLGRVDTKDGIVIRKDIYTKL